MIKEYFFSHGCNKILWGGYVFAIIIMLIMNLADVFTPNLSVAHRLMMPWVADVIIVTLLFVLFFAIKIIVNCEISIKQKYFLLWCLIIFAFVFVDMCSRGDIMKGLLYDDPGDTFMDFFNSIRDSTHPYKNGVIYPPLINVFYLLLKQLMDTTGNVFSVAGGQIGKVVILLYALWANMIFFYLLYKYKTGKVKERLIFCVTIVFSAPYLFCLERSNSILLCVILLLFFFYSYTNESYKIRRYAYCALGGAVGIKIVPAIFLILVWQQNGKKDFISALKIVALFFLLPFIVTQGTPLKLLANIQYTASLFQGFEVSDDNTLTLMGHGVCVNIISFFHVLRRIFNVDFLPFASTLNVMVAVIGVLIVMLSPSQPAWKNITILTGIVVACPGFSYAYNLLYFLLPLMLFLDSKPANTKRNIFYLIAFIFIFLPWVNIETSLFATLSHDRIPMRLSAFFESIAILCLLIVLELEMIVAVLKSTSETKFYKYGKYAISIVMLMIIVLNVTKTFRPVYVDKFYSCDVRAGNSVKGIYMVDGEYKSLSERNEIYLNAKPLLENGLLISFTDKSDVPSKKKPIEVLLNGEVIDEKNIDPKDDYIYVEPAKLEGLLTGDNVVIGLNCKVDLEENEKIIIDYAGPLDGVVQIDNIHRQNYTREPSVIARIDSKDIKDDKRASTKTILEYKTKGIFKRPFYMIEADDIHNPLWMKNEASILLDKKYYKEGAEFRFVVPDYMIDRSRDTSVQFRVDGQIRKVIDLSHGGQYNVFLSPEELGTTLDDGRSVIELQIEALNTVENDTEVLRDSIRIDYLGPCANRPIVPRKQCLSAASGYYSAEDLAAFGFYVVYQNDYANLKQRCVILANDSLINGQEIFKNDNLSVIYVSPDSFKDYQGIVSLDVKFEEIDGKLNNSSGILYAGMGSVDNVFLKGRDKKRSMLTYGLTKGVFLGTYNLFAIDKTWLDGDLDIECFANDDLFWQKRGRDVKVLAVVNGTYIGECKLNRGRNHMVIPKANCDTEEKFVLVELYTMESKSAPRLEDVAVKGDDLLCRLTDNYTYFQLQAD